MVRSRTLSVAELLKLGSFVPAAVQRDFKWAKPQGQELLGDLERAAATAAVPGDAADGAGDDGAGEPDENSAIDPRDDNASDDDDDPIAIDIGSGQETAAEPFVDYYLGSMILRPAEHARYEIFDGLQRMTVLTILLCVLRDNLGEGPLHKEIAALIAQQDRPRLTLSGDEMVLHDEIQSLGATKFRPRRHVSDRGQRMRQIARDYDYRLSKWGEERKAEFARFLLRRTYVTVVEVEDVSLARQIFIATNMRGIRLEPVELFKGQLVDLADESGLGEKAGKAWDAIQERVGDRLQEFMVTVDVIERRKDQGPDCLARLIDYLRSNGPGPNLVAWLDKVTAYAEAWDQLHSKLTSPTGEHANPNVWKLGLFEWSEWKPLAVAWYADYLAKAKKGNAISARAFHNRFDRLHRACMAITLARFSEWDRAIIMRRALSQWAHRNDPFRGTAGQSRRPHSRAIRGALTFNADQRRRIGDTLRGPLEDDDIRRTLLRWLEASLWPAHSIPGYVATASIEHILPQRPATGSQWLVDFHDYDERYLKCHSIGNLTTLDFAINKEIANAEFGQKQNAYARCRDRYKLLQTPAVAAQWKSAEIEARADELIALAWKTMGLRQP